MDLEDRLRLSWYREVTGSGTRSGARPLTAFADLADEMRQATRDLIPVTWPGSGVGPAWPAVA
jgi:hypothetical protein